jgi:hypothetical protein
MLTIYETTMNEFLFYGKVRLVTELNLIGQKLLNLNFKGGKKCMRSNPPLLAEVALFMKPLSDVWKQMELSHCAWLT